MHLVLFICIFRAVLLALDNLLRGATFLGSPASYSYLLILSHTQRVCCLLRVPLCFCSFSMSVASCLLLIYMASDPAVTWKNRD